MAALTLAGAGTSGAASSGTVASPQAANFAGGARLGSCGDPHTPASNPFHLVQVGGTLFFTADDGVHGVELWKSDGTKAGTVLVKDIGPTDSRSEYYGPNWLTNVGGRLFFTADDGVHGEELWTSDGTRAGTVMVKDILPGSDSYYGPRFLTAVGDTLFFSANDGAHGDALWKSDGTKAGTVMLKELELRTGDYGSATTAMNGVLFFTADDGVHGDALWKSDGSTAGTVMVKDINQGPNGYSDGPAYLTPVGDTVFFSAVDEAHGRELWKSDGTEAGTVLVKDIHLSSYSSGPSSLLAAQGKLFFAARDGVHGDELWESDGTEAGTVLVKDINPEARDAYPRALTGVGGTVFFSAQDGVNGPELWKSDGTEAGTVLVKDIETAGYPYPGYGPQSLTDVGGTLFFAEDDGAHGWELWRSDGTEAGTSLVADINPGSRGSEPSDLTGVGGALFFDAKDSVHRRELWQSDGTAAGTSLVRDVNAGGGFIPASTGTANTRKGTLTVKVAVKGAGHLVVGPAGRKHLIQTSRHHLLAAGTTTVKLTPTAEGMRKLRRALRAAHRRGQDVGTLDIRAKFTFTPCGGSPSSQTHRYTLMLR